MRRDGTASVESLIRRHLLAGWSMIFVFLTLGLVLETFHGLKIGWYMDVSNATRRLMWTLAHAHGTLLGLVHAAFAVTLRFGVPARRAVPASACLLGASVLLPGGFLLGGIAVYGGDPGLGAWLTPLGAALLGLATLLTLAGLRAGVPATPPVVEPRTPEERSRRKR